MSRAATNLDATHTTVARRLRGIEKTLAARLFDQLPEGYVLTPTGQEVVEAAERVEAELFALEAKVQSVDVRLQGKLRVTTTEVLLVRYQKAIAAFPQRYPDVDLSIECDDNEVSLPRRGADVALRLSNSPPEYLFGRKLERMDFAVYGNVDLVRRIGPDAPYAAYPWLYIDERLNPDWLDQWFEANASGARVVMRVNYNYTAFRQAILDGTGIFFLPCFEGDTSSLLSRIGPVHAAFGRDVWILTLSELRANARVRAFMDHVIASVDARDARTPR